MPHSGSKSGRPGGDTDAKPSSSSQSRDVRKVLGPSGSSGTSLSVKRDSPSVVGGSLLKKPKLLPQTFTPLGRPDVERRGSPTTQIYIYEEIARDGNVT